MGGEGEGGKRECSFCVTLSLTEAMHTPTLTRLRNCRNNVKLVLCGCKIWEVMKRITRDVQIFINRCLRNTEFLRLSFLQQGTMEECIRERSDGKKQTAEKEVGRTHTEGESCCLYELENPMSREQRKSEKALHEKDEAET